MWEETGDRRFRYDFFPQGPALVAMADDALAGFEAHEARTSPRTRARKESDQRGLINGIGTIIANLAHAALFGENGDGIVLPLGHSRRSPVEALPAGFQSTLTGTVEGLQANGILTIQRPSEPGLATTITPTAEFRQDVLDAGIGGGDIQRRQVLNPLKLSLKDQYKRRVPRAVPQTEEAAQLSREVVEVNRYLSQIDLSYVGNTAVDLWDRNLTRYFNLPRGIDKPSLAYGGRWFGGVWQPMPKPKRRNLRSGGSPLVELDFGQVMPRLAYAHVGAAPPGHEDFYHLPEVDPTGQHRDGIKKAVSALFYGATRWNTEIAGMLPPGWTTPRFRDALVRRHPAIAELLRPGSIAGWRLMGMESSVMAAILTQSVERGVVALPIHDAVLTPYSSSSAMLEIMEVASRTLAGASLPVSMKG